MLMPSNDSLLICNRPQDANSTVLTPNCKNNSGRIHGFLIIVIVVPVVGSGLIAFLAYCLWVYRRGLDAPGKLKIHSELA